MSIPYRYLLIVTFFLLAGRAAAQVDTAQTLRNDSAGTPAAAAEGGYVMTKNPTTAILFSIVPGGGQLYNRQYWKVPLFAGVAGYFIWRVIYFHNLYIDRAAEAQRAADQFGPTSSDYQNLKFQREQYRDDRDLNAAYVLGVEILGMIDAYVGAHMFDFDVDDISSRIYLNPINPGVGFQMRW
jgi:Family of unknown function (DUF5683)